MVLLVDRFGFLLLVCLLLVECFGLIVKLLGLDVVAIPAFELVWLTAYFACLPRRFLSGLLVCISCWWIACFRVLYYGF